MGGSHTLVLMWRHVRFRHVGSWLKALIPSLNFSTFDPLTPPSPWACCRVVHPWRQLMCMMRTTDWEDVCAMTSCANKLLLIQQILSNIYHRLATSVEFQSNIHSALFFAGLHQCLSGGKPRGTSSPENNRCSESMTDILSCLFYTVCMMWHDRTGHVRMPPYGEQLLEVKWCRRAHLCENSVWTWCWTGQAH